MAEPALMPPPVAPEPDIRAQAREWARKIIPSSALPVMRDAVEAATRSSREDDDDSFHYVYHVPWEEAVLLLRRAANHYPHPSAGALFDAAFKRIDIGLPAETAVERDLLTDIIKDILENPDALLD